MIKIWHVPEEYPEDLLAFSMDQEGVDYLMLYKAERLGVEEVFDYFLDAPSEEAMRRSILYTDRRLPLVSPDLVVDLGRVFEESIQPIPVTLRCGDGAVLDYFLVNVLNGRKVIDLDASECVVIPGTSTPFKFNSIKLFEGALDDCGIGRDSNYSPVIFVTDCFLAMIPSRCREGMGISDPSDFLSK